MEGLREGMGRKHKLGKAKWRCGPRMTGWGSAYATVAVQRYYDPLVWKNAVSSPAVRADQGRARPPDLL